MVDREVDPVRFVPGTAVAIVGPHVAGLVVDDPRSQLVKRLAEQVAAGVAIDDVIEVLAGHGVLDLPSFGLVTRHAGAGRLLVRGDVIAQVEPFETGAFAAVSGDGVRTWVEHAYEDAAAIHLQLAGDLSELGAFEVDGGLLPACRIEVRVRRSPEGVGWAPMPPPLPPMDEPNDVAEPVAAPVVPAPTSVDTLVGPFDASVPDVDVSPESAVGRDEAADLVPAGDQSNGEPPERAAEADYDHLFGVTQLRTVEGAAVRPASEPVGEGDAPPDDHGLISRIPDPESSPVAGTLGVDHDGHTVSLDELLAARSAAGVGPVGTPAPLEGAAGAPVVHAVRCGAGHLNPTHATHCRVCGAIVAPQEHITVPRPALGVLRFSDGRAIVLESPMLIGRSPRVDGAAVGELPELVVVASPLKEVSGTHLEVRLDGWQVFVVDRQSTNGTVATLPGRDPQRLRPGEPFLITPGTTVSLAAEVEFRFEATA